LDFSAFGRDDCGVSGEIVVRIGIRLALSLFVLGAIALSA
jgi:hypothetical protein